MEMNSSNLLWFFAFLFLVGANGFGGLFGNNRVPMGPPPATQQDLTNALNFQSLQNEINNLGIAASNNNYETARLLQDQSMMYMNQNNANQINVLQGFNAITAKLDALYAKMESCCCEIKTQMLQDRLADKTAEVVALQTKLDNRDQTQTILNNLGRFVAWAGSGSQTVSTGS